MVKFVKWLSEKSYFYQFPNNLSQKNKLPHLGKLAMLALTDEVTLLASQSEAMLLYQRSWQRS
jgi:hypothetical protein